MTVTETLKDAVGLGHGGPSTRTFNAYSDRCDLPKRICDIEHADDVAKMEEQEY